MMRAGRLLNAGLIALLMTGASGARATVLLQEGAATLGDLSPIVIRTGSGTGPDASLEEAVRRHARVFRRADDPLVRVHTLNRIQNLQARFGDPLGLSEKASERLHREALDDFETLLAGAKGEREAELLYEAARASDIAGQPRRSVGYLERILEQHGNSQFMAEAAFRTGEHRFSQGRYADAAEAFRAAREHGPDDDFRNDSLYMLGWSRFLNDEAMKAAGLFLVFMDRYHDQGTGFASVSGKDAEQVADAQRVLSLIATYDRGPETLARVLDAHGDRPYVATLYDHLLRFLRERGDHQGSVATAEAFRARYPDHAAAPAMLTEVVESWRLAGNTERMRDAMAEAVEAHAEPDAMAALDRPVRRQVMGYLRALGVWHYTRGQALEGGESRSHYRQASQRLRQYADRAGRFRMEADAMGTGAGYMVLLAGDAALRGGRIAQAAGLYECAAWSEPPFPGAGEAAYALVQLRQDQWHRQEDADARNRLIADARRFVQDFPWYADINGVRQTLANRLYEAGRYTEARGVARTLVDADATDDQHRAGWILLGHLRTDAEEYANAASAWAEVRKLTPEEDDRLADFRERHGLALYREAQRLAAGEQSEQARTWFQKAYRAAPGTDVAASARYDETGLVLELAQWDEAIRLLQTFRQRFPEHELAPGAGERIVHAHRQAGRPGKAADAMLATDPDDLDPEERWSRQLRAARYYREAGRLPDAVALYERYLADGTDHLGGHAFQQERRHELAMMQKTLEREEALAGTHRAIVEAEDGAEGTARSARLASRSALWLGRRAADVFGRIELGAPLEESLARKRDVLSESLEWFRRAERFGIAETATESTYRMAELYRQLAQDVLDSERPSGLTDLQANQYEMLLEEEAYPFEEKAIELHQRNQQRIPEGHWTGWVSRSLDSLADLFPARYERDLQWTEARHEAAR
ncbi:tetratricopeptide repeat protein [Halospina sp. K52047b]|uniref:tetratricopeptide repeat protein n=1 Tax=Halospina sp. K52047b TaxID=2614160 RepID=UPI0017880BB5|nr:tetratricopeptide repeat protein [Halospina sp. K52047b]